jgi:hypothetical protein
MRETDGGPWTGRSTGTSEKLSSRTSRVDTPHTISLSQDPIRPGNDPVLQDRLQQIPFIGRQSELKKLYHSLQRAEEGHGSSWLLVGSAGIGKTRLSRRVSEIARSRGFSVRWSQGLRGSTTPLFPFIQLLRTPPSSSDGTLGVQAQGTRSSGGPVDLTILGLQRDLERLSEETPQLLVLDDVQWAEAESFRALKLLVRTVPSLRVVLVAIFRDDAVGTRGTIAGGQTELLDAKRSGDLGWLELRSLNPREGRRLATTVLGVEPEALGGRPEIVRMVDRCGGNPYFIIETLRTAIERGQLVKRRNQWTLATPIGPADETELAPGGVPEPIRKLLVEQFRTLDPEDQALVVIGARIGVEFDAECVRSASSLTRAEVTQRLVRLARSGWPIHSSDVLAGGFVFDHSLLRESLADPVEFPLPQDVTRRAATWYAGQRPQDVLTRARLLIEANQHEEAGIAIEGAIREALSERAARQVLSLLDWIARDLQVRDREFRFFIHAGSVLREALDHDSCRAVADRILRLNPPDWARWPAEFWTVEAAIRARQPTAREQLSELAARAGDSTEPVSSGVSAQLAYLDAWQSLYEDSPARVTRRLPGVLRTLRSERLFFEFYRLSQLASIFATNKGRPRLAAEWLDRAQSTARGQHASLSPAGLVLVGARAYLAYHTGDRPAARRLYLAQAAKYRSLKSPAPEAQALLGLGTMESDSYESEPGRVHLRAALAIAQRLNMRHVTAPALRSLGWIELRAGRVSVAKGMFEQSLREMREMGMNQALLVARLGLALVKAEEGDSRGAWTELERLTRMRTMEMGRLRDFLYRARARTAQLMGDNSRARAELLRALAAAETTPNPLDRAAVLQELFAFEDSLGRHTYAARWRAQLQSVGRKFDLDVTQDLKGIGFPMSRTQTKLQSRLPELSGDPTLTSASFTKRLLLYLGHDPGPLRSFPSAPRGGQTELDIGRGLGVRRERFARALRRMEQDGLVTRTLAPLERGGRVVSWYSLTPPGHAAARALAPGTPEFPTERRSTSATT